MGGGGQSRVEGTSQMVEGKTVKADGVERKGVDRWCGRAVRTGNMCKGKGKWGEVVTILMLLKLFLLCC